MANSQLQSFFLILLPLFAALSNLCLAFSDDRKVYIVYMGALPSVQEDQYSVQSKQLSILQNALHGSSAEDRLVRSYKRSFNGFAALLTEEEQQKIASMEGVVSVFPSRVHKLHTTRSWDFIGLAETVKRVPAVERDIIVGFLDSGIWPESESFSDEGFGPPPKKWKGSCQTDGNVTCNNKLIGARYYIDSQSTDELTARDTKGHGTHTASTAAGREVSGASLYGLAQGNARGAVPSARIAMYKVCSSQGCMDSSILAAYDDAIADGVDIISVSLGRSSASNYSDDSIAIGAFQAMLRGILTSQSAGNSGPAAGTLSSVAPWIFTVAASSTDRKIVAKAIIGDGTVVQGRGINTFPSTKLVPLILGANASTTCSADEARYCSVDCLDEKLVKGKIVVCENLDAGYGPSLAGAVGQIVAVGGISDYSETFGLPSTRIGLEDAANITSYIVKTKKAQAKVNKSESVHDARAPVTVSFSSRGPNDISSNILKPDISAPGVDILAAFSPVGSLTTVPQDKRSVNYHILSGTSMACPHVSGAAAYVKSFHPSWSPAAIKSALMTTASLMSDKSNPEAEFAFGAGQINPVKAVDPGLVYDANKDDYIRFLCDEGYSAQEINLISGENVECSRVTNGSATDLNYPSKQLLVAINKPFSSTFSRSVTNVGSPLSTYKVTVNRHPQLQIAVKPAVLSFKQLNEKQSFNVKITGKGLKPSSIHSSSLVWSDGVHSVRSPIVVYTQAA